MHNETRLMWKSVIWIHLNKFKRARNDGHARIVLISLQKMQLIKLKFAMSIDFK